MWKDVLLSRSIRLLRSHCLFCVLPRDPNPKVERLYESDREDHTLRVQNFSILNRHIRAFYQVGEVHRGRRVSAGGRKSALMVRVSWGCARAHVASRSHNWVYRKWPHLAALTFVEDWFCVYIRLCVHARWLSIHTLTFICEYGQKEVPECLQKQDGTVFCNCVKRQKNIVAFLQTWASGHLLALLLREYHPSLSRNLTTASSVLFHTHSDSY